MQLFHYILASVGLSTVLSLVAQAPNDQLATISSSDVNKSVALDKFIQYIQIDTSHPSGTTSNSTVASGVDYTLAERFLTQYISEVGLTYEIYQCKPGKPTIVAKYAGSDDSLPSIMFNSHMDVVAANRTKWDYDPFGATLSRDRKGADIIYGRGTQDNKSSAITYLEAIRVLKAKKYQPKRNIYLTFSPDQEIGGTFGMQCFVESDMFKKMQVEFVLGEGNSSGKDEIFPAFYTERAKWALTVEGRGDTAHASFNINDLAIDKIANFHKLMTKFRIEQRRLSDPRNPYDATVTNSNLISVQGGTEDNTIPDLITVKYDLRVSPAQNYTLLYDNLHLWANQSQVSLNFTTKQPILVTENFESDKYYTQLNSICKDQFNVTLQPTIYPGSTGLRFLRAKNVSAIGFAPYRALPVLAHFDNEFMKLDIFYEAINFFVKAIPRLGSI